MYSKPECVLCNQQATQFHKESGSEVYYVECNICGRYKSSSFNEQKFRSISDEERAMLSAYTRELYEYDVPVPELHTLDNENQIQQIIYRYKKKTVGEKFNNLILYAGKKSHYIGEPIRIDAEKDYPITYSTNKRECDYIINEAKNSGFLRVPSTGGNAELTWKG